MQNYCLRYQNVIKFFLSTVYLVNSIISSKCNVPNKLVNEKNTIISIKQKRLLLSSQIYQKYLVLKLNFLLEIVKILWFIVYFCAIISGETNNFTIFEGLAKQNNTIIIKFPNLTNKNEQNNIQNVSFKVLSHHLKRQQQLPFESKLINDYNRLPFTLKPLRYKKFVNSTIRINDKFDSYNSIKENLLLTTKIISTTFTLPKTDDKRKKNFIKKERIARQLLMPKILKAQNKKKNESLEELYEDLEVLKPCNRKIDTPLVRRLLSDSIKDLERNLSIYSQLFKINPLFNYPING